MSVMRTWIATLTLLGAVASGCGGGSETVTAPTIPTSDAVPATSAPSSTTPETTAAPTTAPATTTPPTTAPPTTAPGTTPPPTSAPSVTTEPRNPPLAGTTPATAFVSADNQLLEIDVATGATVRVIDEVFQGDGVFRAGLRLSPDGSTIWYSEGYEDNWFGCETSIGSWGRIDTATGAHELMGVGSSPEPSADGEFVAFVTSSLCLPDPENPEFFVLTPADRVVVRNLATGEEREFVTDTPPDSSESPGVVLGALFAPGGSLLVLVGDGRLFDVDLNGPAVIQDHPVALSEVNGHLIAATSTDLLTIVFGDEGSTDLIAVAAASGEQRLLASSGVYMGVGVSADLQIIVAALEPITVTDSSIVMVLEVPDDMFVVDLEW